MIDKLFSNSKILEKSLDATWMRNEMINQNIANVDTPGYKRKDVAFEELLSNELGRSNIQGRVTDSRHIPIRPSNIDSVNPSITQDNSNLSMRLDGNSVDVDSESAKLAKNTIQYNTLVQMLNGSFSRIKSVISEGRR